MMGNSKSSNRRRGVRCRCDCKRSFQSNSVLCRLNATGPIEFNSARCPLDRWPDDGHGFAQAGATPPAVAELGVQGVRTDPIRFFTTNQRIMIGSRRQTCTSCDSNRGRTVLTVNFRSCGFSAVSLIHGRCYLNKWSASSDPHPTPEPDVATDVDHRGGWRELVEHGVTGWLCNDDREFVYRASRAAFEPKEREQMQVMARKRLEENWGLQSCTEGWELVFRKIADVEDVGASKEHAVLRSSQSTIATPAGQPTRITMESDATDRLPNTAGAPGDSGMTGVILNWKRPENVKRILSAWQDSGLINEGIVWNNFQTPFTHQWARVVNTNHDLGLYTRFAAACLAHHDCVFIQDDDIELPSKSLTRLFTAWKSDPRVIHGVFGRAPRPDGTYARNVNGDADAPVVLTRALLVHRKYVARFFEVAPIFEFLQRDGKPEGNGEDIILSYSVMNEVGRLNRVHSVPVRELRAPHSIHGRDLKRHVAHRTRLLRACESWLKRSSE